MPKFQFGLGSLKDLLRLGSYCCYWGTVALLGGKASQESLVIEAQGPMLLMVSLRTKGCPLSPWSWLEMQ